MIFFSRKLFLRHFASVSSFVCFLQFVPWWWHVFLFFCLDVPSHSFFGKSEHFLPLFAVFQPGHAQASAPAPADHCCHLALEELLWLPRPSAQQPQHFLPLPTPWRWADTPHPGQPCTLGTFRPSWKQTAPSDYWPQFLRAGKPNLLRILVSGVLGNPAGAMALSSDSSECGAQSATRSRKESEKALISKWKVWCSLPQTPLLNGERGL